MKWISKLYILFVGIILTITTGFGIAAFYPEPQRPEFPYVSRPVVIPESCLSTPSSRESIECQKYFVDQENERKLDAARQQQYEQELKKFNNKNAGYTRTAVFFGISIGALFAVVSLLTIRKSKLVASGIMLAGVLTAVLTRFLIKLASLGANVSGTEVASIIGYIEFGVLLLLSILVIFVGFNSLKEEFHQSSSP